MLTEFFGFLKLSFKTSKIFDVLARFWFFFEESFHYSIFLRAFKVTSRIFSFLDYLPKFEFNLFSKLTHPAVLFLLIFLAFMYLSNYVLSEYGYLVMSIALIVFSLTALLMSRIRLKDRPSFSKSAAAIFGSILSIIGLVFLSVSLIHASGIPLFNPSLRRILSAEYEYLAFLLVPGALFLAGHIGNLVQREKLDRKTARNWILLLTIISTALVSLLGYRTEILVLLLGIFFIAIYLDLFSFFESFIFIISIVIIALGLSFLRQLWLGGDVTAAIIGGRIGATLAAFDYLANRGGLTGISHGLVYLSSFSSLGFLRWIPGTPFGPRTLITHFLGGREHISTTSTLLGPIVIDFGLIGVIVGMVILGGIVGIGHKLTKITKDGFIAATQALLLAFVITGIETGLVDFIVIIYFIFGIFVFLAAVI